MEVNQSYSTSGGNSLIASGWMVLLTLFLTGLIFPFDAKSEQQDEAPIGPAVEEPDFVLKKAVLCERLKGSDPVNQTIVFSPSKERVFCFTVFDPVLKESTINHNWYYKDKIISRFKRSLQPPRWETYSSHIIGNRVTGPWRVEITDEDGNILSVLRFSVSD